MSAAVRFFRLVLFCCSFNKHSPHNNVFFSVCLAVLWILLLNSTNLWEMCFSFFLFEEFHAVFSSAYQNELNAKYCIQRIPLVFVCVILIFVMITASLVFLLLMQMNLERFFSFFHDDLLCTMILCSGSHRLPDGACYCHYDTYAILLIAIFYYRINEFIENFTHFILLSTCENRWRIASWNSTEIFLTVFFNSCKCNLRTTQNF